MCCKHINLLVHFLPWITQKHRMLQHEFRAPAEWVQSTRRMSSGHLRIICYTGSSRPKFPGAEGRYLSNSWQQWTKAASLLPSSGDTSRGLRTPQGASHPRSTTGSIQESAHSVYMSSSGGCHMMQVHSSLGKANAVQELWFSVYHLVHPGATA